MTHTFRGAWLDVLLPAVRLAGYIFKQYLFFSHIFSDIFISPNTSTCLRRYFKNVFKNKLLF